MSSFQTKPQYLALLDKLHSIAPDTVLRLITNDDGWVHMVFTEGRSFPTDGLELFPGCDGQCHRNALSFYLQGKGAMATGYALHDRVWNRHSWGWSNSHIIETTSIPRDAYYGVIVEVMVFLSPFSVNLNYSPAFTVSTGLLE